MNESTLDETYEQWVSRCQKFEYERAIQELNLGKDVSIILEQLSVKLTAKLLHPLYGYILEDYELPYDSTVGCKQYEEYFRLKNLKPKADHIVLDK